MVEKPLLHERPPLKSRPPGAPAGTWPHTPWWHCVYYDPYERVNFWSHFLPGVALLALGASARAGAIAGGFPLVLFSLAAATTHLLSALTHVWPDDVWLEKADHLGIVALILGTPYSLILVQNPDGDTTVMALCAAGLLGAALLRPLPRTLGFLACGAVLVAHYWHALASAALLTQVALYVSGAACFLRGGGHQRCAGLTDHHLLHYQVTLACALNVAHLVVTAQRSGQ